MPDHARELLEQLAKYLNCEARDLYFLFEPAPQGEMLDAIFDMPDSARERQIRSKVGISQVGDIPVTPLMAAQ